MERSWNQEFRTTLVCVDDFSDRVPKGRFYNTSAEQGKSFRGMMEFLLEMENTLESVEFPRAFTVTRSFGDFRNTETGPPGAESRNGKYATFALRILFRQNSSWQGSLLWLEGKKEQSFRSVLELVLLMNSALAS